MTIIVDLMASIASSTAATILLYPIERIKIEMQLDRQDGSFRSSYDRILRKYGLSGFYQGASSLVLGNTFAYGIYFVVYERLKAHFKLGNEHSLLKIPLCSGIAGCIGSIATNPFYVIQTRQTNTNKSFFAVANEIAAKEGLSSLEKGLLASLILVTNPIIQFLVYEWLKNKLKKNGKLLSWLITFIIGAISKIIATLLTYPYTLLRTRQQMAQNKQISLLSIFKQAVDKEGLSGIFKGLKPKLIQTTLNSAVLLMIYEKIRAELLEVITLKKVK